MKIYYLIYKDFSEEKRAKWVIYFHIQILSWNNILLTLMENIIVFFNTIELEQCTILCPPCLSSSLFSSTTMIYFYSFNHRNQWAVKCAYISSYFPFNYCSIRMSETVNISTIWKMSIKLFCFYMFRNRSVSECSCRFIFL